MVVPHLMDVIPWTFLLGVPSGAPSNGLNSMNLRVRVHVECHDIRISFTSLPFCLFDCYVCGFFICDDHQFLLMWADVRALGSSNGNRDAAAWWVWTCIGLSMESSAEDMLLVRFLSSWIRVVLLLMYCSYVRPSDAYFLLLRTCLGYCVPSDPIFCTPWIFMYVAFY